MRHDNYYILITGEMQASRCFYQGLERYVEKESCSMYTLLFLFPYIGEDGTSTWLKLVFS